MIIGDYDYDAALQYASNIRGVSGSTAAYGSIRYMKY